MKNISKVTVGILVYNGQKYFDFLFPSLFAQDYPNLEILVLDNASPENDAEFLRKKWNGKIKVFRSEQNLGFGGGHNFLIRKMQGDFYFCLNQDVIIEQNFISRIINLFKKDPRIGSVTGKLKRWDFEKNKKTNRLDTTGIRAFCSHRFTDRGQGEEDRGQYDKSEEIFAGSAAAIVYRKEALDDTAFQKSEIRNQRSEVRNKESVSQKQTTKNSRPRTPDSELAKEYFDELMFMYKEDIDLGYRLRWAGWKNFYEPTAVGYHDRSVSQKKSGILGMLRGRKEKSAQVRKWSWLHQQILLHKNFSAEFSWKIKLPTYVYQFLTGLFLFFREPRIFWQSKKELKLLEAQIRTRKKAMKRISPAKELEQFFG